MAQTNNNRSKMDIPIIRIPENAYIEYRGSLRVPLVMVEGLVIGSIHPLDPEGFMRVTVPWSNVTIVPLVPDTVSGFSPFREAELDVQQQELRRLAGRYNIYIK